MGQPSSAPDGRLGGAGSASSTSRWPSWRRSRLAPRALAELVEATGLPRATAHRLAVALEVAPAAGPRRRGPLRARSARRRARRRAARPASSPRPRRCWPGCATRCGESAQLYRRDGAERVCVAAAERAHGLRTTVPVGTPAAADGRVRRAGAVRVVGPPPVARRCSAQAEFTARTLAEVRRRGWAQSVGQREAGVASVSAPVLSPEGELLGAVSVSGPIERLGRSPGTRIAPLLVAGARRITAALDAVLRRRTCSVPTGSVPHLLRPSPVRGDVGGLEVLLDALEATLAAEPGLLHAAERRGRVARPGRG